MIRDNSHKLNFLRKLHKMAEETFQEIEIMYR